MYTDDDALAKRLRMIARHGQSKKYYHEIIGVNSRLDSIQANLLRVKLRELDDFITRRQAAADYYDESLKDINGLIIPKRNNHSNHVFHQYTMRILDGKRDELKAHLATKDIPSMIYYPVPLYYQNAFKSLYHGDPLSVTEMLCEQVLSLPIHTEMTKDQLEYIVSHIKNFF